MTCGTQYPATQEPPRHCLICEDERQYIGWDGQAWTTLDALRADHHNVFKTIEPGLTDIAQSLNSPLANTHSSFKSQAAMCCGIASA
jgi:hypothetical protein